MKGLLLVACLSLALDVATTSACWAESVQSDWPNIVEGKVVERTGFENAPASIRALPSLAVCKEDPDPNCSRLNFRFVRLSSEDYFVFVSLADHVETTSIYAWNNGQPIQVPLVTGNLEDGFSTDSLLGGVDIDAKRKTIRMGYYSSAPCSTEDAWYSYYLYEWNHRGFVLVGEFEVNCMTGEEKTKWRIPLRREP